MLKKKLPLLTLDITSDDHDEIAVVIGMMSVVDSCNDFARTHDFLHGY